MPAESVRITDPYAIEIVEREQARRGLATAAKAATQMILERGCQTEDEPARDDTNTQSPEAAVNSSRPPVHAAGRGS